MNRRTFIKMAGLGAAAASNWHSFAKSTQDRPNFVIIFTDDQGYQDLGCFGSPKIKTPNIDRMAQEGMRFTDFYVAACVCTPSRAALMTGCYPKRVGLEKGVLFPRSTKGLNPKEITIAKLLKQAGYKTACFGKWHLGHHEQFLPTNHGFDEYFGIPYSNDMAIDPEMPVADNCNFREGMTLERMRNDKPTHHWVPLFRGDKIVEYPADQTTLTQRYTEEAIRFIKENKDNQFFIYVPHAMPHVPLFASEEFAGKSKRGLYGDVIECIDWGVGRILDALKDLGLDKNTIVVFTSDNGPWLKKGDNGGCALPLRDGKGTTYEGGMREPTVMWAPGRIPAGVECKEVATTMDLYPTFAKLAGAKVPGDRVIDGRDIWPLMTGLKGAKTPHEAFFYYNKSKKNPGLEAVRMGKWKLLRPIKGRTKPKPPELYDLEADISESTNLAEKYPDKVETMIKVMEDFDAKLTSEIRPAGEVGEVSS